MKYVKFAIALLAVLIAVGAAWLTPKPKTESDYLLDTYVSVTLYDGDKEDAKAVLQEVRNIHNRFSAFLPESEIAKINRAEAGVSVPVSGECYQLIERAIELFSITDGAFDITVKPLMDLWDFSGNPHVPTDEELKQTLPSVDSSSLVLDKTAYTVTKTKQNMQIDLGGIAKGYASDRAAKILKSRGVTSAVLDFGGNVVTVGEKPQGVWDMLRTGKKTKPFTVGIQKPGEVRGTVAETVTAKTTPCAVVTSGGYERNFTENGKNYHHIINPKTGRQPENGIVSVTVVAEDATAADALSTAIFVSGPDGAEKAKGLFEEILIMTENGEIQRFTKE
ncbi:MAG: FAD:protein FMN transferase [Clostridia bacterium]|nr:FAD:protein FMN transferase [Clostridia bacterium]